MRTHRKTLALALAATALALLPLATEVAHAARYLA